MKNIRFLVCSLIAAFVLSACNHREIQGSKLPKAFEQALVTADTVTLYSLQPYESNSERDKYPDKYYGGTRILGQVDLRGDKAKKAIAAVKTAIEHGNPMESVLCFNPRHGLRIKRQNHVYDFLICYECSKLETGLDGKADLWLHIAGSPQDLNGILQEAHIPLSSTKDEP